MVNYNGDLHNFLMDVYEKHYRDVGNPSFIRGWLNRIRYLRENGCHTVPRKPVGRTNKQS